MYSDLWYIIVNPCAGSGKTIVQWDYIKDLLTSNGVKYKYVFTEHQYHAKTLAYTAASEGYRKIAAVGGDGSVHEVLCGAMHYAYEHGVPTSDFVLGVIPIGSGNDWIKSRDLPSDLEQLIPLFVSNKTGKQDVIKVESAEGVNYMANVGGSGFDANVCVRVNRLKARGKRSRMIYNWGLLRTIMGLKAIRVRAIADGKEVFRGPFFSLAVGNGIYSGGGMKQTAGAIMDDGLMDVLLIPKVSIPVILKEIHGIFDGSIIHTKQLKYLKCKQLELVPMDGDSSEYIEVDGEVEGRLPVRFTVTGDSIRTLCR